MFLTAMPTVGPWGWGRGIPPGGHGAGRSGGAKVTSASAGVRLSWSEAAVLCSSGLGLALSFRGVTRQTEGLSVGERVGAPGPGVDDVIGLDVMRLGRRTALISTPLAPVSVPRLDLPGPASVGCCAGAAAASALPGHQWACPSPVSSPSRRFRVAVRTATAGLFARHRSRRR